LILLYNTIVYPTTLILPRIRPFLTLFSFANMPVKKNHYPDIEGEPEEVADAV
jgi:hypothetical protein